MTPAGIRLIIVIVMFSLLTLGLIFTKMALTTADETILVEKSNVVRLGNIIDSQRSEVSDLKNTISELNIATKKYETSYLKAKAKLSYWDKLANKKVSTTVVDKVGNPLSNKIADQCNYGLRLNKEIAELDYDSL